MKILSAMVMSLGLITLAQASDLNQNALVTLLNTPNLSVEGDVHSYETVTSIYKSALKANAKIENECSVVKASQIANCTLWLTFTPIGETALQYTVKLPGHEMDSNFVNVSRGD